MTDEQDRGQEQDASNVPDLKVVNGPEDFDPWKFRDEDTGYERTKFYTKSRDKDGGQSVQCQVTRAILRDIDELVAEKVIPEYRTRGDVIRDAVYHRLKDVAEMKAKGQLHKRVTAEIMVLRRMARMDELQQLQLALQGTTEALQEAARAEHWDLVSQIVSDTWDDIENIPEPFQSKTTVLLREYGKRADTAKR